ncbi:MAG: hypothetical protein ACR2GG_06750, partial [Gemmatimonadaceae bacterium]
TNLGSVKNTGFELGLRARLVDRPGFSWDANLNGSTNSNELLTLGVDATGAPLTPQVFSTYRQQPGYPVYGYWQRKFSYSDANKDGVITRDEITVADSSSFLGYSRPRYETSLSNAFEFFNHTLRFNTLFDYKGGNKLLNGTERIRCSGRNNCRGVNDKTAPLDEQARAVVVSQISSALQSGYMEDASFVRFRELSVSGMLPSSLLGRTNGSRIASLTFSARNLHTWTGYTGIDPESNAVAGTTFNLPSDFQTVPPPTFFILRLNLGF